MEKESGLLSYLSKISKKIFGSPRNIHDPKIFHKLALIPLFAWVGLGADGLSSSAYGPEETFKALNSHPYLAVFLVLATVLTVTVISVTYSKTIEHFPNGGGGYVVASHLLGEKAGLVSGAALIIDYILTITVSITACADAVFSFFPAWMQPYKVEFSAVLIVLLIILNIRGVKESILMLAPIFLIFILSHLFLIIYGILAHQETVAGLADKISTGISHDVSALGSAGVLLLLLRAYSLGSGTYTGIEAVSNGMQIMREPRVKNGRRTMLYMAVSLAFTAGGLILLFLLYRVQPVDGMTLNAVLSGKVFAAIPHGDWLAIVTVFSEGALLLVAAQAGFIDAPRVMANMALDSWLPRRFSMLSDRLTMRNGIVLIGSGAILLLFLTKGSIAILIIMYSINVFITFSLTEFGMLVYSIKNARKINRPKRQIVLFMTGFIVCFSILAVTVIEKFSEGGWVTLVITILFVCLSLFIRKHYKKIQVGIRKLDEQLKDIPLIPAESVPELNVNQPTAIQLVGSYNGFGVHTFLSVLRSFPGLYKNFVFVSIGLVDQGIFKGETDVEKLKAVSEAELKKYAELAAKLGIPSEAVSAISTDVVDKSVEICRELASKYRKSTVFTGQLSFRIEKFYHRLLHNETAYSIQKKLHWSGIPNVILPVLFNQ